MGGKGQLPRTILQSYSLRWRVVIRLVYIFYRNQRGARHSSQVGPTSQWPNLMPLTSRRRQAWRMAWRRAWRKARRQAWRQAFCQAWCQAWRQAWCQAWRQACQEPSGAPARRATRRLASPNGNVPSNHGSSCGFYKCRHFSCCSNRIFRQKFMKWPFSGSQRMDTSANVENISLLAAGAQAYPVKYGTKTRVTHRRSHTFFLQLGYHLKLKSFVIRTEWFLQTILTSANLKQINIKSPFLKHFVAFARAVIWTSFFRYV